MIQFYNRSADTPKRQQLRRAAPPVERLLWVELRDRQIGGSRFRRQYGVGPYVLDFFCPALKLAIEVDGPSHDDADAQEYDTVRTDYLRAFHIHVLRFSNAQIYHELDAVVAQVAHIATLLSEGTPAHSPDTPPQPSP